MEEDALESMSTAGLVLLDDNRGRDAQEAASEGDGKEGSVMARSTMVSREHVWRALEARWQFYVDDTVSTSTFFLDGGATRVVWQRLSSGPDAVGLVWIEGPRQEEAFDVIFSTEDERELVAR